MYQDVLSAGCFIAEQRLEVLRAELGDAVRWQPRPYPLRIEESLPSAKELRSLAKELEQARGAPEGSRLSSALWTSGDPPRSSLPALAALEAAKLQGGSFRAVLARGLQRAALEQGVNVTRPDVVFELAAAVGLDMNRFTAAYEAPQTRRLILEEHRLAVGRGVKRAPALVIGGRWMISGLREISEYREHILRCIERSAVATAGAAAHLIH